jgi:hypothetical protein
MKPLTADAKQFQVAEDSAQPVGLLPVPVSAVSDFLILA